jgi:hypothetical protein
MRIHTFLVPLLLFPSAALADGNVGVGVGTDRNHIVSISGDGADNEIEVRYGKDAQNNDVLIIEGKNGTTVRGEAKLEIPLPDGTDQITGVSISPGAGNDQITVDLTGLPEGKRLEEVEVEDDEQSSAGDDSVTVKNARLVGGAKLKVDQGEGDDTTVVDGCDVGNLNINGRTGDEVTIQNCNVEKRIKIDGDHEGVTIRDSFYQGLQMKKGVPDTVQPSRSTRVERTTGGKISYQGNEADEEISFEDNELESVSVKLADGADLISFTGSTIGKVSIDGGPGDFDCFDDTNDNNVFGSFKEKGFEPCDNVNLAFESGAGTNPMDPETWPEGAVAWRTRNSEASHLDGPFALPGHGGALGLLERDPTMLAPPPAHWGIGPECVEGAVQLYHAHDAWEGHGDPDDEGCGHGFLEWGFFLPG